MKYIKFCILIISLFLIGLYLSQNNLRVPSGVDKILHFGLFFMASYVILKSAMSIFNKVHFNLFFIVFLIVASTFSWATELIQTSSTVRTSDVFDWIANLAGLISASVIVYFPHFKMNNK